MTPRRIAITMVGIFLAASAASGGALYRGGSEPAARGGATGGGATGGGGATSDGGDFAARGGALDYAEFDFERWYADAQATLLLPQGGSAMRRLGGATARLGYYADDFLAVEASASWMEDAAGLSLRGLWHWWGYEKFDPFFTFGAAGWIDGDVGPSLGWGAFWHFDDDWSLRFDADATLGLDSGASMVYSLSLGVQRAF